MAFDPATGCTGKCDHEAYREGVRQWVRSVRRSTHAAGTEVALFTGRARGNLASDDALARTLRRGSVRVLEGDFDDSADRVAHGKPGRFVRCVMRNRWFVIRDHLRAHIHRYRSVLMTDVRDALLQADPFTWTPSAGAASPTLWTPSNEGGGDGGSSGITHDGGTHFDLRRSIVLSGEGSGSVRTLRESKKGKQRTLLCAGDASESEKRAMLATDPLNAGVTLGGAEAFLNFSSALATLISRVTTLECLAVKDCTDQGLYNLLAYLHWERLLPHTRRVYLPVERALSYTLGHKRRCPGTDDEGRLRNGAGDLPPVVHQFAKGAVGKALRKSKAFRRRLDELAAGGDD